MTTEGGTGGDRGGDRPSLMLQRQISASLVQNDIDRLRRQISQRLEVVECKIAASTSTRGFRMSRTANEDSSSCSAWALNTTIDTIAIDDEDEENPTFTKNKKFSSKEQDHYCDDDDDDYSGDQQQEQQSNRSCCSCCCCCRNKETTTTTKYRKRVAFLIGLGILAGIIVGFVTLKDFMKSGDIQFLGIRHDEPGTAIITPEELALHNTPDDCWIVFYGNVYDLTNYARRHPGGPEFVTDLAGVDGTVQYEIFHSEALLKSVQKDIVGTLMIT